MAARRPLASVSVLFLFRVQQRNRPDPVPVALLGQLAVDRHDQGQGHARSLLLFALRTALEASALIGSTGVITHPLDDGVRAFYGRWGFHDLPFDPRRAMIVRMADFACEFWRCRIMQAESPGSAAALNVNLHSDFDGVVDLDPEIPHRAFDFAVPKK